MHTGALQRRLYTFTFVDCSFRYHPRLLPLFCAMLHSKAASFQIISLGIATCRLHTFLLGLH
jgi:hypothetical protein